MMAEKLLHLQMDIHYQSKFGKLQIQKLETSAKNPLVCHFSHHSSKGNEWKDSNLSGHNGIYEVRLPDPPSGWTAFFIEFTFPGYGGPLVHKFTTEVSVVPEKYPCRLP
jgi:hypothetical protein